MAQDSKETTAVDSPDIKAPLVPKAGQTEAGIRSMQGLDLDAETIQAREQERLDAAASRIRKIDALKQENWSHDDQFGHRIALDSAGRELMPIYGTPNPPLLVGDKADKLELGNYSDENYRIFLNQAAEPHRDGKLLGDNSKEALRTYAHEWRHSYQYEQANVWKQPQFSHLLDDPVKAGQWAENIPDYVLPPPDSLFETDPNEYNTRYESYRHQPVEEDARRFADELVAKVYGSP